MLYLCNPFLQQDMDTFEVRVSFYPEIDTNEDVLVTIEKHGARGRGFTLYGRGPFLANTRYTLKSIVDHRDMPSVTLFSKDLPIHVYSLLGTLCGGYMPVFADKWVGPFNRQKQRLVALQILLDGNKELHIKHKYE